MTLTSALARRLAGAATAGALAVAGALVAPASAIATASPHVVCRFEGVARMSPPMTSEHELHDFRSDVRFFDCTSSDPTIVAGTATTTGTLVGGCAQFEGVATQRVRWSNGRTSVIEAWFANAGPAEVVTERVVKGHFVGLDGANSNAVVAGPEAVSACQGEGLAGGAFSGVLVLGTPPLPV